MGVPSPGGDNQSGKVHAILQFTCMCLVTRPTYASMAGGYLALIQPQLSFKCILGALASQLHRKNNGFPILDILGYLKNTHKKSETNPNLGTWLGIL